MAVVGSSVEVDLVPTVAVVVRAIPWLM